VFAAEPLPIAAVDPEPVIETALGRASEAQPATIDDDDLEGLDYLTPEDEPLEVTLEPQPVLSTPLFEGFSEPELVAVMRGMNLRTFGPGDILMAEGAPGDSLFVLTTGSVKCWVKDRKGHYMKVQDLPEGAFFGEISVLTGKPRTATLTAAAHCEALELDKKTLDEITAKHPRVRDVLKKFHEQRAIDTVQAMSKKKRG
jgi:cAMP-dependent protein kinase regulator